MQVHTYRNANPASLFLFLGISLLVLVCFLRTPPEPNNDAAVLLFGAPFSKTIWAFPLFLLSLSLLYSLTWRYLSSPFLIWFHTFTSLCAVLALVVLVFFGLHSSGQLTTEPEWVGNTIQVLTMVLFLVQLAFLVNLFKGVYSSWHTS